MLRLGQILSPYTITQTPTLPLQKINKINNSYNNTNSDVIHKSLKMGEMLLLKRYTDFLFGQFSPFYNNFETTIKKNPGFFDE